MAERIRHSFEAATTVVCGRFLVKDTVNITPKTHLPPQASWPRFPLYNDSRTTLRHGRIKQSAKTGVLLRYGGAFR